MHSIIFWSVVVTSVGLSAAAPVLGEGNREVRVYLPYKFPLDPAGTATLPEMDISFALASRLIELTSGKQPTAAVAERWEADGNVFRFHLGRSAKWSDGTKISAKEVKKSFERAFAKFPNDLRSVIGITKKIRAKDDQTIEFELNVSAKTFDLPQKLSEANYGIVFVKLDGSSDLTKSSGPYYLERGSESELLFRANPHWRNHSQKIPTAITIKQFPKGAKSESLLLTDSWPNLVYTSSLIPGEVMKQYKEGGFEIWKTPLDRVFIFILGRRAVNTDGFALLRFLNQKLNRQILTRGLTGYSLTEQLFPKNIYSLFDPDFKNPADAKVELPKQFASRPLEILMPGVNMSEQLRQNIVAALKEATGQEPVVQKMTDYHKQRRDGQFDLYISNFGLADPDVEGVMSFYFEGELAPIQSVEKTFLARLDIARNEADAGKRVVLFRKLLSDAVTGGHILPFFHMSSVGLGRPELDFSEVPTSDESPTFSKIRFKRVKTDGSR